MSYVAFIVINSLPYGDIKTCTNVGEAIIAVFFVHVLYHMYYIH